MAMESNFDEYALSNKFEFREWKRMLGFLKNHKRYLIPLLCCTLITAAVDSMIPYFSRYAFNVYVGGNTTEGILQFILLERDLSRVFYLILFGNIKSLLIEHIPMSSDFV